MNEAALGFGAADEHKALIAAYNELVATMDFFKRIDIIAEEIEKLRADNIDGRDPKLN